MKIKRTLAAIIAATTMAVGVGSISANAIIINWDDTYESGNIIDSKGSTIYSLIGEQISKSIYNLCFSPTHTTTSSIDKHVIVANAINDSSTTRYMSACVYVMDAYGNIDYTTDAYSSGDTSAHGVKTAISNNIDINNYVTGVNPCSITFYYKASVHGGTSYHAAVQSTVELCEYYLIN